MDSSLDEETISTPFNFNVKQLIVVHNYLKTKQLTTEVITLFRKHLIQCCQGQPLKTTKKESIINFSGGQLRRSSWRDQAWRVHLLTRHWKLTLAFILGNLFDFSWPQLPSSAQRGEIRRSLLTFTLILSKRNHYGNTLCVMARIAYIWPSLYKSQRWLFFSYLTGQCVTQKP